ncbi:MAG: magnesium/cobalt transporter CorA, partial [Myxococcales bacterium]
TPRRRRYFGGVIRIIATRGSDELVADAPLDRLPALLAEAGTFVWVDLTPPIGQAELCLLRDTFHFHPLAIEDCFESRTQPKIDEYEGYLYLITHGLSADSTAESGQVVELDAFVSANYLVTHHDKPSRSVTGVTESILKTCFPLRRGPLNVLHALLDRQVEGLEEQLDSIEERITQIEDAVFERPANNQIAALLAVKRTILQLRRWMSKQREVVLRLGRREFALVPANEAMLFRDVHDHLVRINDLLENFREMLTSIQEAYLSVTSNRLNEIMKFLTVFTALLMPLTVITGIYGMNFEHMPELRDRFGYPAVLLAMAVISGSMLLYFRRRGWLGAPPKISTSNAQQLGDAIGEADRETRRTTRSRQVVPPPPSSASDTASDRSTTD